ncbi:hypothetical protein SFC65_19660 [Priestia filamentosa]|uniref:hypothetical protein n=1 Tax=Priestia filamentosa TaxID=1402861 RepID=UPI003982B60B
MPINIQPILDLMQSILQGVGQIVNSLLLPPSFIAPPLSFYREIKIPVPQPPGVTGLPTFITFDLSNQFTADQEQEIRDAIALVLFNWFHHLSQKWNGGLNNGLSDLAACALTYSTKNLKPVWYQGVAITNGRKALEVAMDQFTNIIKENGIGLFKARIDYINFSFLDPIVLTVTSATQHFVPLNLVVNATKLDDPDIGIGLITGSMFHAWLHRAGFLDPNATSYFITEASMCVMRGYQPKAPGIPDSLYYRYFF